MPEYLVPAVVHAVANDSDDADVAAVAAVVVAAAVVAVAAAVPEQPPVVTHSLADCSVESATSIVD